MEKTFIAFLLLLFGILFHPSCLRKSAENLQSESNDTCGVCKAFSIREDKFEHLFEQDTLLLNYDSGEKVVFRRGGKDTLTFFVINKNLSALKGFRVPCACYYNYFDYLRVSIQNQDSINLSISWNVSTNGPTKMDKYPNYHNIMIKFKDIDFKFFTSPFVKDSTYTLTSTTLKTYTCSFRNGKITKLVAQGGEQWEVIN